MRNLHQPSTPRQVAANRFFIKDTRQKPHAFRWWEPDCTVGDGCAGNEPPLENNWAQPSAPLEKFAFRLHADGSLETKGHLDTSGGAVSGTVAVTVPGATAGEVDFRLPNNQFFHTTITTDDGTTFSLALVELAAATGEITITWPAT